MIPFLVTVHVLVCFALIIIVLLNAGKGADVGAVFGGSQAMFGGEGPASFMNKLTAGVAIAFMVTSMVLALMASRGSTTSVVEETPVAPITAPAATSNPDDLQKAMDEMATKTPPAEPAEAGAPAAPAPATTAPEAPAPEAVPVAPVEGK